MIGGAGHTVPDLNSGVQLMQRSRRPTRAVRWRGRSGAASLDYVLILGVVLPIVAFVLPASRVAVQASFAWFCRITSSPFL